LKIEDNSWSDARINFLLRQLALQARNIDIEPQNMGGGL